MTYNVFSGMLNPTQSIDLPVEGDWCIPVQVCVLCPR